MRRALLLLPWFVAACGFGFERRSEVIDRRVLAIRAEPPEFIADGSPLPEVVKVSALVVEPNVGSEPVAYEWRTCTRGVALGEETPEGRKKGEPDPATSRCDEADPDTLVASGQNALGELSSLEFGMAVPANLGPLLQVAASRGFPVSTYVQAQLRVADERGEGLYAFKRFVVSPPLPAGRVANKNPRVAALLFDGVPWPADKVLEVPFNACAEDDKVKVADPKDDTKEITTCRHKVTPAYDPRDSEAYTVQQFDGQTLDLHEKLRFDWYVTQGSFSDQQTQEQTENAIGPLKRDSITTRWNEPSDPSGTITLWVVVRDGRGGESWERRQLTMVR